MSVSEEAVSVWLSIHLCSLVSFDFVLECDRRRRCVWKEGKVIVPQVNTIIENIGWISVNSGQFSGQWADIPPISAFGISQILPDDIGLISARCLQSRDSTGPVSSNIGTQYRLILAKRTAFGNSANLTNIGWMAQPTPGGYSMTWDISPTVFERRNTRTSMFLCC